MTQRRPPFSLLVACTLASVVSCDGGQARTPVQSRLTRTDSAGIPILAPHAPAWDSTGGWRVDPDPLLTIGVADGDLMYELYNVWSAYRRDDGSIVIGNAGSESVRIFDEHGRFVRELGRHGNGPGEYQDANDVFAYRGDSIAVFDRVALRLTLYDEDGELGRTAPLHGAGPGTDIVNVLDDGGLIALTYEISMEMLTGPRPVEQHGNVLRAQPGLQPDTLQRMYLQVLGDDVNAMDYFKTYGYVAGCGAGYVAYRTDTYEVRAHDVDGELRRIIRPAIQPEPFTDSLFEEWKRDHLRQLTGSSEGGGRMPAALVAKNRRMLATARQPRVIQPLISVTCDSEGNYWVLEYPPASMHGPSMRFSVFTKDGEWLGRVHLPDATQVYQIGRDFILAGVRDADEVEQIRVYALTK